MIPQKLSVKNFLSYQQLHLDFAGLHTACICGDNGAGKSSLLEAITWAIWGESRAGTEDDIIHFGAKEARVDFVFQSGEDIYRVIRTRPRGSAGSLEFQINSEGQFRSLTERGVRATQQAILSHLKMDYDTFVNSAYLRQGRADEFMLKRPSDRKQVLAEMLNLSQYDSMHERAKEIARNCRAEATALENTLANVRQQIADGAAIAAQLEELRVILQSQQSLQESEQQQLAALEAHQQQRQTWLQQLNWQKQQYDRVSIEYQRLQEQLTLHRQQLEQVEALLAQAATIHQAYAEYQKLQAQEEVQNEKLQQYQFHTQHLQQWQQQLAAQASELQSQLRHWQAQLETHQHQQQDLQGILTKTSEVEAAQQQLQQARGRLNEIEHLQTQVSPLQQRHQTLAKQIEQEILRIQAKLEELQRSYAQLQIQQQTQPQLLESLRDLDRQIETLQKKQVYQQRVHDKGLERRDFLERLKSRAVECENKLSSLLAKQSQLAAPHAPCPLCDRPLDRAHWEVVKQKHQQEERDLQAEAWLIKEQQAVSECEIQVLRQEYRQLVQELSILPKLLEQRGQLQAQIQATESTAQKLSQLEADISHWQHKLQTQDFLPEAQAELALVEQSLARLDYDERNHALIRGEVERWRWAEIKAAEIKNARRQFEAIAAKLPEIQNNIQKLSDRLQHNQINLELQEKIAQCQQLLAQIAYDPQGHQKLRAAKQQAQPALLRYQELGMAQQQHPALEQQYRHSLQTLNEYKREQQNLQTAIANLNTNLENQIDPTIEIAAIRGRMAEQRSQIEVLLGRIGRLEQAQQHLLALVEQEKAINSQLDQLRYRQRLHQELQQAFGKNGIQSLTIETILPQIEAEANQILAQLSDYQLNVRFITQKAGKKSDKVIETLDIEIADSKGTRPYETYSGGEAFRINFAIRLALSRVFAQRLGGKLQTLIVDEGFGTQDQEGCDRLVAAINAIAPNFACILIITHMPQLKESFNAYLEVRKTDDGSKVRLVV